MDVVTVAERSTEQFVQIFYQNYDTQRSVSRERLRSRSTCTDQFCYRRLVTCTEKTRPFCGMVSRSVTTEIFVTDLNRCSLSKGNAFSGAMQFSEFLSQLPISQHEVDVYDCQPIAGQQSCNGYHG